MNRSICTSLISLSLLFSCAFSLSRTDDSTTVPPELIEHIQQFSRAEGYKIAEELKMNANWIDLLSVVRGIQDYLSETPIEKSPEKESDFYQITLQLFQYESERNLQKADSFLLSLAQNPAIHSLEDGKVLYEIIKEGENLTVVKKEDTPLLQSTLCTQDGLEIANTYRCGNAQKTPLKETVPGFMKGIEGMQIQERRKIYIHPDLGYGKIGNIPPNSLLIADVEVCSL